MVRRAALLVVLVVLAACGDPSPETADGPGGRSDAGTDAAAADARGPDGRVTGPVEVTIRTWVVPWLDGGGEPDPGVQLVFVSPDGAVHTVVTTDADGHAIAQVEDGSSLSVIRPQSSPDVVLTLASVRIGDHVVFGQPRTRPTEVVGMNLAFAPPPAGAFRLFVAGACVSGTAALDGSGALTASSRCAVDPFDVAVMTETAAGFWAATARGVVPAASGTITLGAWEPVPVFESHITGLPPMRAVDVVVAALQFDLGSFYLALTGTTDAAGELRTWAVVPPIGDGIRLWIPATAGIDQHVYYLPREATGFEADVGPFTATVTAATLDPATLDVSWTEMGPGTATANLQKVWYTQGGLTHAWYGPRPAGAARVRVPDLSATVPELALERDVPVTAGAELTFVTGGYDAVRTNIHAMGIYTAGAPHPAEIHDMR